MRICIVTPGFSADEDDWCIPAQLDLVRELARRHEVTVVPLRYPGTREPYSVHGARVFPLGAGQIRKIARGFLLLRAVRTVCDLGPFDVVHALFAHEPGYVATRAARRLGIPSIVSILGGELVRLEAIDYGGLSTWSGRALVRRALRGATVLTAGSDFLANVVRSQSQTPLVKASLGVEPSRWRLSEVSSSDLLPGSFSILHVGSLVPVKDHATLLRALAKVRRRVPGACLHLVGEGPLRRELDALRSELELEDHVVFHGAVEHSRLVDYYRGADVAVVSSRFESQCLAVSEAAASGLRTIGTRVGLLPELADETELVDPGDPEQLASTLEAAWQERQAGPLHATSLGPELQLAGATERFCSIYEEAAGRL